MTTDLSLFILYLVVLLALAWPFGLYMFNVFAHKKTWLDRVLTPLQNLIFRLIGVDIAEEMPWRKYLASLLWFNFFGFIVVLLIQLMQDILPLNPEKLSAVAPFHLAFNTAVSFVTNTNWQAYGGESTMSYLTQMVALTVQNFLSAATGITVAIALIRGFTGKKESLGNFWVDLVRCCLWILLPASLLFSLFLVQQGVIQNFDAYVSVTTLEGVKQTLAMGPVASQEAIKMLGTNGGGFFNANSSHPFENPTPLTNFVQMLSIFLIPAGLTVVFGKFSGNRRQGHAILATMSVLFILMLSITYFSEHTGNPLLSQMGIAAPVNMEGKEMRFGIASSSLFATITTAASCGAVNAMHDSFTPLGGIALLLQMMLGEVVFGGVGAGFYGMMVFVILTVFIVGLMVGRTPEYLGKKIEARETTMATIAILAPGVTILFGSALASAIEAGTASIANPGPHGLTEILYAFSSAAGNNGSAFAGLSANTIFYNMALSLSMLIGRFGVIIPALAIAGSMAQKKISPPGPGTFATTGWLYIVLLSSVVLIVGALTFLPALALGPIVEHLLMNQGMTY